MSEIRKPGFFVVGAPKSGTTSLYHYLKQHPRVFLPRIKELNFFCRDLHFRFPLLNEEQFMNYYKEWKHEKIAGEISVWNLLSEKAASNIRTFNPEARIIIMLRNPADMMYALHSNHLFNDNELITDFAEAIRVRRTNDDAPVSPVIKSPLEGLNYYHVATYYPQVKRYFDEFGRDRVHVILFDDFVKDTVSVYRQLLRFLGTEEIVPPEFKVFNASKTTRNNWLKQLTVNAPPWMKKSGRWLFPHQSSRRDMLMFWLWKINTREEPRKAMNPAIRKKINHDLRQETEKLQGLLQRDLSQWFL
jgi:hypothetical protein